MPNLLSITECAARKGVSRQAVHQAIQRGDLIAQKIGNTYVIEEDSCEAWQPNRAQAVRGKRGAETRKKPPESEE